MRALADDELLTRLDLAGLGSAADRIRDLEAQLSQARAARGRDVLDDLIAFARSQDSPSADRAAEWLARERESGWRTTAGHGTADSGITDAEADQLVAEIAAAYGLDPGSREWADVCAIKLGTEAGETQDAWLRHTGRSRRPGSLADVASEIADVEICNRMLARTTGIDIGDAVRAKLQIIRERGWKDQLS